MQQLLILGDPEHIVRHGQKRAQLARERGRPLALSEKILKRLAPYAPGFADLQTRKPALPTPPVDRNSTHSQIPRDLLDAKQVLPRPINTVYVSHDPSRSPLTTPFRPWWPTY